MFKKVYVVNNRQDVIDIVNSLKDKFGSSSMFLAGEKGFLNTYNTRFWPDPTDLFVPEDDEIGEGVKLGPHDPAYAEKHGYKYAKAVVLRIEANLAKNERELWESNVDMMMKLQGGAQVKQGMYDPVHEPKHYHLDDKGTELKDLMPALLFKFSGVEAGYVFNMIKYAVRQKDNRIQDLEKVIEYAQMSIDHLKEGKEHEDY